MQLLHEPADMHAFGVRLAQVLRPGDLIILSGDLGAGKTTLTKGIGAGLGVAGVVASPTFIIARVHRPTDGRIPLVHVDAYRLSSLDELDDLDLDVSMDDSVTVVEWGSGMAERLSDSYLEIHLEARDDDARELTMTGHDGDWSARIALIEKETTC